MRNLDMEDKATQKIFTNKPGRFPKEIKLWEPVHHGPDQNQQECHPHKAHEEQDLRQND
jgi:hypothetical protein